MLTYDQIEAQLADLHLQRGHLASHGKDTSKVSAEIMRLHQEQATLADVEAARVEQAREEQDKQHLAAVAAVNREIADFKSASAKALADSRAAYHAGAAAMRTHLETEASLRKAATRAKALGVKVEVENEFELARKRSLQIASVGLKPINNHLSRFGNLSWPMALIAWK